MFGQGKWRPGCSGQATCDTWRSTLRVFGGYKFNDTMSAEVAYNNLGKASGNTASIKGYAWEAVGIAAWPLFSALSVYGKLGIFRGKVAGSGALISGKETNYGPTYGVGAQVEISRKLSLRGDWQSYPGLGGSTLPKNDVNVVSAGALWRFR